jgi:DNA-binding transcriptional ArsR family regulator
VTPEEANGGLAAGLEAMMRTSRRRVTRELNLLATHGRSSLPAWLNLFAADTTRALTHVTTTLQRYHDAAIAPHHDLIKAGVDADRTLRARHVLDGGVEGLLHGMRPLMDWQPPVLHVRYDVDQDLHLLGRGVRLVPSYFCHGSPVAIADPALSPVIIYPVAAEHRWSPASCSAQSLRELLGTTRANVLSAVTSGASTTQLARILRISPASASRHATVLRNAGLVHTHRHGPAVLHTLTPLGTRLLQHL